MNMIPPSRSLVIAAGSTFVLLPIVLYYLLRRTEVKPKSKQAPPPEVAEVSQPKQPKKEFVFQKENVTLEAAMTLNQMLNAPDANTRYRALVMIQQSSAFSSNFANLKESNCLESMLRIFEQDDDNALASRQNLCILQTLTNMVCDPACFEVIKEHLDRITQISFSLSYSDQACAALQVLCNLALTAPGCRLLDDRLPQLFAMLETTDPYMLRQVLSVLLNLSCDATSCDLILNYDVSDHLITRIKDSLSPSAQPLVLLQLINLLKNLYTAIGLVDQIEAPRKETPSTREFLLNSRVALKIRVQFILSEPSIADTNVEVVRQADALLDLLSGPMLPTV